LESIYRIFIIPREEIFGAYYFSEPAILDLFRFSGKNLQYQIKPVKGVNTIKIKVKHYLPHKWRDYEFNLKQ